jgi:hypothetical protein
MQRKHAHYPYFDISEVSSKLEESKVETLFTASRRGSFDSGSRDTIMTQDEQN